MDASNSRTQNTIIKLINQNWILRKCFFDSLLRSQSIESITHCDDDDQRMGHYTPKAI